MKSSILVFLAALTCTGCAHFRRSEKPSAVDAELAKHSVANPSLAHTTGPGGAAASAAGREARSYDANRSPEAAGKRGWLTSNRKAAQQRLARDLAQAESLAGTGKLTEAREIYQRLVVECPQEPQALHGLGLVADRQRKHHEAQALYVQALALKPREAAWLSDLGWSYYLDGQLDKAQSALAKAVALAPAEPRHHNNLGLVLGQQRKHPQALEEFRKAGSEADAQYNMAFVLTSQDDSAGAKRCFQLALAADPSYVRARDALRAFEQYEQDPKAAELAALDTGHWIPYVEDAGQGATLPAASPSTGPAYSGQNRATPVSYYAPAGPASNGSITTLDTGSGGAANFGTTSSVRSPIEGIQGAIGRALPNHGE